MRRKTKGSMLNIPEVGDFVGERVGFSVGEWVGSTQGIRL